MASGPRGFDPEFVSATRPAQQDAPTKRDYSFLETWKMPEGGVPLGWYKLKVALNSDYKANHTDYLTYAAYQQNLKDALRAHAAEVERLKAEYRAELAAADAEYDAAFEENEREYIRRCFESETEQLIKQLQFLDNLGIRPIMAFCNIKSAGKTTTLLQVLSVIAQYTRRTVLAIPATQNSATSTLALMAGIPQGTGITIEELSRRIDELGSYRALSTEVPKTPNGVSIVSEDLNNALHVDNEYNLDKFVELLLKVLPNVDYIGLDLGNDNIRNDSIALAAGRFAHVLNFSYLYNKPVTIRSFENTVSGYNSDHAFDINQYGVQGFEDILKDTGIYTPTTEKVANSIVIANLAPLDADVDYGKHMDPTQRVDSALPQWQGSGFNMPYDPYLDNADESGEVKPASLEHITDVTHQQALKIAVANLFAAADVQNISTDSVPPIVAPEKPVVVKREVAELVLPPEPVLEHPFPSMLNDK